MHRIFLLLIILCMFSTLLPIQAAVTLSVTGFLRVYDASVADIIAGGRSIVIDITSSNTWISPISDTNIRSLLIASGTSTNGWTSRKASDFFANPNYVISRSATRLTIVLPPIPLYNINVDENIIVTAAEAHITGAGSGVAGTCNAINCILWIRATTAPIPAMLQLAGTVIYYPPNKVSISNGGRSIIIILSGAIWNSVLPISSIQNMLIGSGDSGWSNRWNVKKALITTDCVLRVSDTIIKITLPSLSSYDIAGDETVSITIPLALMYRATADLATSSDYFIILNTNGSIGPLSINSVTGSAVNYPLSSQDIIAGGRRIVITIDGGVFVSTPPLSNILLSIVGSVSGGSFFEAKKSVISASNIFRTSSNILTIVLPPIVDYSPSTNEYLSIRMDSNCMATGTSILSVDELFSLSLIERKVSQQVAGIDGLTIGVQMSTVLTPAILSVSGSFWSFPPTTSDIQIGMRTIVITISGVTWINPVPVSEVHKMLISSILPGSTTTWEMQKLLLTEANVQRQSPSKLIITLPPLPLYNSNPNSDPTRIDETISVSVTSFAVGRLSSTGGLVVSSQKLTILNIAGTTPAIISISGTFVVFPPSEVDMTNSFHDIVITLSGSVNNVPIVWSSTASNTVPLAEVVNSIVGTSQASALLSSNLFSLQYITLKSPTVLRIRIPSYPSYSISSDETVVVNPTTGSMVGMNTVLKPSAALADVPSCTFVIPNNGSSQGQLENISGTLYSFLTTKQDIILGGKTIHLKLSVGLSWAPVISVTMIQTMLRDTGTNNGVFNNALKTYLQPAHIYRINSLEAQITLPPFPSYVMKSDEFISITVPNLSLTTSPSLSTYPTLLTIKNLASVIPSILNVSGSAIYYPLTSADVAQGYFSIVKISSSDTAIPKIFTSSTNHGLAVGDAVDLFSCSAHGISDGRYIVSSIPSVTTLSLEIEKNLTADSSVVVGGGANGGSTGTMKPINYMPSTRFIEIEIRGVTWRSDIESSSNLPNILRIFKSSNTGSTNFINLFTASASQVCVQVALGGCPLLKKISDVKLRIILPPLYNYATSFDEDIIITVPMSLHSGTFDLVPSGTSDNPFSYSGMGPFHNFKFTILNSNVNTPSIIYVQGSLCQSYSNIPTGVEDIRYSKLSITIVLDPVSRWLDTNTVWSYVMYNTILQGSGSSSTQWNSIKKLIGYSSIVISNARVLTINIPSIPSYSTDVIETITINSPPGTITGGNGISSAGLWDFYISPASKSLKPRIPSNIQIQNNNLYLNQCVLSLSIEWTQPYSIVPILSYEVQSFVLSQWMPVYSGPSVFTSLRSLSRNTVYSFRIRAVNSYGAGLWSTTSTLMTRNIPQRAGKMNNMRPNQPGKISVSYYGSSRLSIITPLVSLCPLDISSYSILFRRTELSPSAINSLSSPPRFEVLVQSAVASNGVVTTTLSNLIPNTSYDIAAIAVVDPALWSEASKSDSYGLNASPSASEEADRIVLNSVVTLTVINPFGIFANSSPIEGGVLLKLFNNGNGVHPGCKCVVEGRMSDLIVQTQIGQIQTIVCKAPSSSAGDKILLILPFHSEDSVIADEKLQITYYGSILITDLLSSSVFRYRADSGKFIDTFISSKSGGLSEPRGIGVNLEDNSILVSSSGTRQILVYDRSTGNFIKVFITLTKKPGYIVIHKLESGVVRNELFVSIPMNDSILRYDLFTGLFISTYASDKALVAPNGFTFSKGSLGEDILYIAANVVNNIILFSSPSGIWSGNDRYSGQFDKIFTKTPALSAMCVAISDTSVFVSGDNSPGIYIFDKDTGILKRRIDDPSLIGIMDLRLYIPYADEVQYLYVLGKTYLVRFNVSTLERNLTLISEAVNSSFSNFVV